MPAEPRQIAFDLSARAAQGRDDLVVSPANRAAVAMIDRWPHWPAPIVAIVGPRGSGKTHLAEAWRETSGAVALAPGELGGTGFEGAVPPLLIDDADAAALDEAGLFHLLNAARAAGSHVLFTARQPPAAWSVELPDLRSRLRTAVVIELQPPDEALLAGVITKLFADRQTAVEPAVVGFLAKRIERSLAAAAAAVETLDKAALEKKSRVTRALAATLLDKSDGGREPPSRG